MKSKKRKILLIPVMFFLFLTLALCGGVSAAEEEETEKNKDDKPSVVVSGGGTKNLLYDGETIEKKYPDSMTYWSVIDSDSAAADLGGYRGTHWCTNFAHWRFWKYWGMDCGMGDGAEMAADTAAKYSNFELITITDMSQIELLNNVKSGSIFSRVSGAGGHVGFIESVEDGFVIFSDGNSFGSGYYNQGIRFNVKQPASQFVLNIIGSGATLQIATPIETEQT